MKRTTWMRQKGTSMGVVLMTVVLSGLLAGCDCDCDKRCHCFYTADNGQPVWSTSCPAGSDEATCESNCTSDGRSPICKYE